jgi:hypothetical protein
MGWKQCRPKGHQRSFSPCAYVALQESIFHFPKIEHEERGLQSGASFVSTVLATGIRRGRFGGKDHVGTAAQAATRQPS